MSKRQLFDLERIRKLTLPIEELQIQLNQLNETSKNATENIKITESEFEDSNYQAQLGTIEELLKLINDYSVSIGNRDPGVD